MKVLLMGAGAQGSACASIMVRDDSIDEILFCDIDFDAVSEISRKINSDKIKIKKVDASKIEEITAAAKGMDVVIDFVTPKFYFQVMQGALAAGVNYINTAFDKFLWDDGVLEIGKNPKLHDEFKAKGISALMGCGMSAGYTNVIAKYYADKLEKVKSIKIRLGKRDASLGKYEEALQAWNPGWDPRQALLDFVLPAGVFRNGKYEFVREPFAEIEEWAFPEPVGVLPVSFHAHEEPYSLPATFIDKGLEYCDFKYYVNMQVAPLVSLGLASEEPVTVGGVQINPLDLIISKIPKPAENFTGEDPAKFDILDKTKRVSIMVEVVGENNGKEVKYLVNIPEMNVPRKKMYDTYGTSNISVSLPAVVGAKMICRKDSPSGVIFPQDLDAQMFLDLMEKSGYEHKFNEV